MYAWGTYANLAVLVAERTDLGEALRGWIDRQRLSVAGLSRRTGVARNTIYNILGGATAQSDTLRKLAAGIATDPRTEIRDESIQSEALRDFLASAGIEDGACSAPPISLESLISRHVKSRSRASVLAEAIRRYPDMTPGDRRLLDAVLDKLELDQQGHSE